MRERRRASVFLLIEEYVCLFRRGFLILIVNEVLAVVRGVSL